MDKIILKVVQAILCPTYFNDAKQYELTQVAETLYRKVMAMPFVLRQSMRALFLVFNAYGIISSGRLFEYQSILQRQRQLQMWRESRIHLFSQFSSFLYKMTVFIYYSVCLKKS